MAIKIITIDGPSGSGKGTLAAKLAQHYQFHLLDSGAIYRLLGLKLLKKNLLSQLDTQLKVCVQTAEKLDIEFKSIEDGLLVLLDGQDVSKEIRTETVGEYASKVAAIPELRAALLQRQRDFAVAPGLVADGRDMGTLVFPEAQVKLFLTASAQSRAERRVKQLQQMGVAAKIDGILANIEARDQRDTQRAVAPLKAAVDAKIIDSSKLSIDEVFAEMLTHIDHSFAISHSD
ncbi:(d)CMP kinase [Acinetobacter qingfengensis]|uniref:Cytidylate kinase n=1 Tax=Acinetobacter qingfengensis TaxID=1262585 RepID=A0A1E7R5N9_9GAMM|nr:(d)CMP kinase [Acinetobacter qingfengensis]KAA8735724.1 (d)CMP kinase [Acinetobacter qingfengensis]OEY94644.1 cytidylate kinase [Acinetobacter qingfengensis]